MAASSAAFKELKDHSVLVFIESGKKGRWQNLTPAVVTGLNDEKLGNIIPKATVTSADMQQLWGSLSYKQMQQDKEFREFKKHINAIREGETVPKIDPKQDYYWPVKGKDGYYIGAFREINAKGKIVLQNSAGKTLMLSPATLTEAAVDYARNLAGMEAAANDPAADQPTAPVIEDWTSSEGKTIRAKFVSFVNGQVTLELPDGRTATLPLSRFNAASQERARELGAP